MIKKNENPSDMNRYISRQRRKLRRQIDETNLIPLVRFLAVVESSFHLSKRQQTLVESFVDSFILGNPPN